MELAIICATFGLLFCRLPVPTYFGTTFLTIPAVVSALLVKPPHGKQDTVDVNVTNDESKPVFTETVEPQSVHPQSAESSINN